jgi:hypothetical protein
MSSDMRSVRDPGVGTSSSETLVDPSVPRVDSKPGYQTSQGILTGISVIAAFVLSFLGFHFTPAQIQGVGEGIVHLGTSLGPLVALIPILTNYINSRGKIASNTVWANAGLQNPLVSKDGMSPLIAQKLMNGSNGGVFDTQPAQITAPGQPDVLMTLTNALKAHEFTIKSQQDIICYLWNEGHPQLYSQRVEPILSYMMTHPVPLPAQPSRQSDK